MKSINLLAIATAISILSACGGGGGATVPSTSAPVIPPPSTPSVAPADLQLVNAAPSYAVGTQEYAAYQLLQDIRASVNIGFLVEDPALSKAASNHIGYLLANPDLNLADIDPKSGAPLFHSEDPIRPQFTGVDVLARSTVTGYGGRYLSEVGSYGASEGATRAVRDLMATVYHRVLLLDQGVRNVGISIGANAAKTAVIDFGYKSAPQHVASDYVGIYPVDKQIGVPRFPAPEAPNPYGAAVSASLGYPISVTSADGTAIGAFTIVVTETGQAASLPVQYISNTTDKGVPTNVIFAIPAANLKPSTTYTVTASFSINGVAKSKTWSFTTTA